MSTTTPRGDADFIVNYFGELVFLPNSHGNPRQGQYNRLIRKREQARHSLFANLGRNSRRYRYWERVFDRTHCCEDCGSSEAHECRFSHTRKEQPPDHVLCWDHAWRYGFCAFCGEFHAGEYGFNFRGDSLCDGCRDELRDCSPAGTFPGPYDIVVYRAPLMHGLPCAECEGAGTLEISQYIPTATETVICGGCGGTGQQWSKTKGTR